MIPQDKNMFIHVFSSRLRTAMSDKSLTQKTLGELTKIQQTTVSDYLNGKAVPSADVFLRLSIALEVSMEWLCGASDDNPSDEKTTPPTNADWKTRAQAAEKKLNQLKGLMNGLGSDVETLGTTVSKLTKFITE